MFKAKTVTLKDRLGRQAGQELGKVLLAALEDQPQACWLFCPPHRELPAFLQGVTEALGTQQLIGCTTDGEISCQGFTTNTAVLGGIVTDQITFSLAGAMGLEGRAEQAGVELAQSLPPETRYLQLFSDGLKGNGCAILRGIMRVLGTDLPITGGTAGDYGRFHRTWQFLGNRLLTDAAVAIGFAGDFGVGTGVRSGWSPIGLAKKVTRSAGNILYELGGQPALEVYERFLGKHAAKLPAVGVEYPLGLTGNLDKCADDEYLLLRATMSVNRQDGSITFAGEIPEGAQVRLTCGDITSVLQAAEEAANMALVGLEGRVPALIFFYSCMARKIILGRRTKEEIQIVREIIGQDLPVLGFYTYGEFCPLRQGGCSYLHNETVTVSVIGI
ncbi:MAG: FIST signal transduction protein [Desulfobacca sp.]|uniref:FIST signal transduction protein n=1 Tax=Desulfobacca sp. TaxID=2067990 RepID=UPI00404AB34C